MPQSVATLFNAPPAPPKNLSNPTPLKAPNTGQSSFHAALNQVKTKANASTGAAHKPAAPAKPQAPKPQASAKKSKSVPPKPTATKAPRPAARKRQDDDPTEESRQDSQADSHDPSADAPHDPSSNTDSVHDASDAGDDATIPTPAQISQAAEQAASAKLPAPDSTHDAKDVHEKHDHEDKKNSESASSSDASPDASAIAGQLTPQAITAVKQTSDQPDKKNSNSDPSETSDEAPVAATPSQATSSAKAHARAVQDAKNQNPDPSATTSDAPASQPIAQSTPQPQDNSAAPTPKTAKSVDDVLSKSSAVQGLINTPGASKSDVAKATSSPQATQRPEARFAEANHPTIVSEIQGKLLPSGGTMDIHLTPQDLGSVHVRVEVRDGSITATFQAADNDTVKLLSHSLTDLKSSLEAQGIAVDKLHVTHAPQDQHPSQNNSNTRDPDRQQQQAFHQEQQRRDMMRRMWRRVMKGQDPLDLVA